jgi:RNA polymerase sigma-70 factor (ECF subfamily)
MIGSRAGDLSPDLVGRIQAGEIGAFEEMFRALYTPLCTFAAGYVRSAAVAEEVVADVFAWIWEHRSSWDPARSVEAFVYGAVRNRCLNIARNDAVDARRRAYADVPPGMGASAVRPDLQAETIETDDALWQAVDQLPETQRVVLILRWQRGMAWADISAALGTTSGAAQMQHARALATLRRTLPAYLK